MFATDSLLIITKDVEGFHCRTLSGQIVNGDEVLQSLHAAVAQYTATAEINYRDKINYVGPIEYEGMLIAYWNDLEISIIVKTSFSYPTLWIFDAITYLRIHEVPITAGEILNLRYKFPSLAVASETEFATKDIFYTIPPIDFMYMIEEHAEDPLIQAVQSNDIPLALQLLNQQYPLGEKEHILIHLNLFFAIVTTAVYATNTTALLDEITALKNAAIGYDNLLWIISLLGVYFFNLQDKILSREFNDEEVPTKLLLLGKLVNIPEDSAEDQLSYLLGINSIVSNNPSAYFGTADLYLQIGACYSVICDYSHASMYYSYAMHYYQWLHQTDATHRAFLQYVDAALEHYRQYVIAANLTYYATQYSDAVKFAWQGMNIALQLLHDVTEFNGNLISVSSHILQHFSMCKRPLIYGDSEMAPVIQLKLDELELFLQELISSPSDDVVTLIEMHQDSLKFLMPQAPPLFLFLTVDGRLLYNVRATPDLASDDSQNSHLMAGVLTAVRSIFMEASFSGSESVKEINTGDSVVLIEARPTVVVVAAAPTLTQTITDFTAAIATNTEDYFGTVIQNWHGSTDELVELTNYINLQIKAVLLE